MSRTEGKTPFMVSLSNHAAPALMVTNTPFMVTNTPFMVSLSNHAAPALTVTPSPHNKPNP
jgi:hypothetical protein